MPKKDTSKYYLGNENLPTKGAQFEYTPEQMRELSKCSKNILHFAENYFYILNIDDGKKKIKLYKAQKRVLRQMMDNRFFILLASRQIGKALALDTPIKTPTGWTTMGDLKIGDVVYGSDGNPCNVTQAYETRHNRPCYEIEFDNGETIIADEDHNWFTQTKAERSKTNGSVKTTKEIFDTLFTKAKEPNHRIPYSVGKVQTPHIELKLPAYVIIKNIRLVESVPVRCIEVDSADHLFLAGKTLIPTHNSTLMTIYILWMANFHSDQRILLVANKESTAIEIFSRVRMAYEMLPNWLKSPVVEFAKTSMELENSSRVSITTTTGTAARGQAVSCVTGDSVVTVRDKENGAIVNLPVCELYEMIKTNGTPMNTILVNLDE